MFDHFIRLTLKGLTKTVSFYLTSLCVTVNAHVFYQAIVSIQSSWRAHNSRQQYIRTAEARLAVQKEHEEEQDDDEDDIMLIQSAIRGHTARKELISKTPK